MDIRLSADDAALQRIARAIHPRRVDPARGRVRGARRAHAREPRGGEASRARRRVQRDQPSGRRRRPGLRHVPADADRGTVGPRHGRAVGHPVASVDPARNGAPRNRRSATCDPAIRGERRDAYAITEEGAGSDVSMVATTARRDGDGWVLDGEKWHVTSGDVADFFLVHAHVDGDPAKATVFLVDKDTPGVRLVRTPKYTHTFVFEHPIFAFDGVRLGDDQVLGEVGEGFELTKDWFVEERIMIGARTMGASARALRARVGLRAGPAAVRTGDRGLPGDRVHARRHGGRDHGGEVAPVPRVLGGRARRRRLGSRPTRWRAP